ncbi:CU044_2847 family protein [Actinoplanes sp. GCM10030250]|uniref:CU044_2847 family protein n=1 Tax=Actinoplanes sp. GCM10030250 TaxID=3273376 RepID=UPI00361BD6D5
MSEPIVRVETRSPVSGDGRQIAARRFGTAELAQRENDLRAAIRSVLGAMSQAVKDAPDSGLKVGELEVAFNVAFGTDDGVYLCSSSAEATFEVKLSLTLADSPAGGTGTAGTGAVAGAAGTGGAAAGGAAAGGATGAGADPGGAAGG